MVWWRSEGPKHVAIKISNVKCTLVQALRLCTGRTAHRGSRGIALIFLDHGTRRGWRVSVTPRPLFISGKDPVPIVHEAGWGPEPVRTGAENLAPTGFDPGPSSQQPVAIPTALPGPPIEIRITKNIVVFDGNCKQFVYWDFYGLSTLSKWKLPSCTGVYRPLAHPISSSYTNKYIYTGCPRRNVPNFGRVFLRYKYTDITQNTYIQSWTVTEIMAREKWGLLAVPRTVPAQLMRLWTR